MAALQELETVIKDPLCAGIEIATNIAGMDLDNQKFDFFWGEIAKKMYLSYFIPTILFVHLGLIDFIYEMLLAIL